MANSYFRFKQFTVHQQRGAMKVCTDSCLFGAWVSLPPTGRLLEIGTGTGLLALMAAQRFAGEIEAVELQPEAADEANENFNHSPWSKRIKLHAGNILDASLSVYNQRYDVIFCNPPFYENHLLPDDLADATARHNASLPLNDLLRVGSLLLNENGSFHLLLPSHYHRNIESTARHVNLHVTQLVNVRNMENHVPIRLMIELKKHAQVMQTEDIVIYNSDRSYTKRFTELLKPYYLYL